jgi:hypothetical protein
MLREFCSEMEGFAEWEPMFSLTHSLDKIKQDSKTGKPPTWVCEVNQSKSQPHHRLPWDLCLFINKQDRIYWDPKIYSYLLVIFLLINTVKPPPPFMNTFV